MAKIGQNVVDEGQVFCPRSAPLRPIAGSGIATRVELDPANTTGVIQFLRLFSLAIVRRR